MSRPNTRSPYEPEKHGTPIPVSVRAAVPGDARAIAPIDVEREGQTVDELAARIQRALEHLREPDSRRYSCVAEVEGRIVGYGKCRYMTFSEEEGADPSIPDGWYLTGVEVLRRHRRRGIGRALTVHRLQWLGARTDVVYYFTGERNYVSQDLHRDLGFEDLARGIEIPLPPPFSNAERHVLGMYSMSG